jgi:hypothetical protein
MRGTCQQPGCERAEHCRGWCNTHYWRMRHGKDMDAPIRRQAAYDTGLIERLYARLDTSGGPDACWPWVGHRRRDVGRVVSGVGTYARMNVGGNRTDYVHRVSYLVHYGAIPGGLEIRHLCNRPDCGNPAHLTIGDHADNMRDAVAAGRHYSYFRGR